MTNPPPPPAPFHKWGSLWPWLAFLTAALLTTAVYWQGLYGSWLFDDYPNIVDNHDLQIGDTHFPSLVRAALSSPSSEFKRPLASLSFAANYMLAGLAPFSWKLTNLAIHLLNGLLVYLLSKRLLLAPGGRPARDSSSPHSEIQRPTQYTQRAAIIAALIAASWMLLPINLTGVLYIVQRMESLANLFVLIGLLGYVVGRQHMMAGRRGIWLCISSVLIATAVGLLAKETAVMLPLYAFLIEWLVFRFAPPDHSLDDGNGRHRGLKWFFALVLVLPMIVGLAWLLPDLFKASAWAPRDFTLGTRLLSEARIVSDYVAWTLLPTPDALSFYHDDFRISKGLFAPWTTLASIVFLTALMAVTWTQRRRRPLLALGLALYLGCHLLTGTILPLELIYEHRNYFASFGLLLAVVPLLAAPREPIDAKPSASDDDTQTYDSPLPLSLPRHVLLGGLMLLWAAETALTASAWGNPLTLAHDLASRAPQSPRAQYELGRTYIIYSHYDPLSPFIEPAYAALEKAAALPESSILPEQALIFMNARMDRPTKDAWWNSMVAKLKARKPTVQDESSLGSLTQCTVRRQCTLPKHRMMEAFLAALTHSPASARLLATYSDYAWNVLEDRRLALDMAQEAVAANPQVPAYRITEIKMLVATGRKDAAKAKYIQLEHMNFGGSLNDSLRSLRALLGP